MGGFFGAISKRDCVLDLFFGVDYHSHLGTRRGGMAIYDERDGFQRQIHSIENTPFRTKFDDDMAKFSGNAGIGCISDTDPQPLLVRSHLGMFAISTVGIINNAEQLVAETFSGPGHQFMAMSSGKINTTELTAALIADGVDPVDLVTNALMPGIQAQCELYDLGKAYVPEILISSDTMLEGIKLAQEKIGDVPKKGTIATFVVEGDLHDIGKNIVAAILRANGFEVVDLGRDVSTEKVIEAIRSRKLNLVNGSTLMSTTKGSLKQIAEIIKAEKLDVPLAAGGSAVSKTFVETFENAVYGKSPIDAVRIAEKISSGKNWRAVREEQH